MSAAKSYRRMDDNNNGNNNDNKEQQQDQSPTVSGYPDAGEAKRREKMMSRSASAEPPQELAAVTAPSNFLSTVLSELKYPATRKEILDYLYLRRERIPDVETILKVVQLLPIDKEYRNASEIGADLGNINEEYNRSLRGRRRV